MSKRRKKKRADDKIQETSHQPVSIPEFLMGRAKTIFIVFSFFIVFLIFFTKPENGPYYPGSHQKSITDFWTAPIGFFVVMFCIGSLILAVDFMAQKRK